MENIPLAEWLLSEMKKRNWNNAELARQAQVSPSAISYIFNDRRKPGPELLAKIAKALNYPIDEVFRIANLLPGEKGNDPILEEIIHIGEQLNDRDKNLLVSFARLFLNTSSPQKGHSEKSSTENVEQT